MFLNTFYFSFETGKVPKEWKEANVIAVLINEDLRTVTNYRLVLSHILFLS